MQNCESSAEFTKMDIAQTNDQCCGLQTVPGIDSHWESYSQLLGSIAQYTATPPSASTESPNAQFQKASVSETDSETKPRKRSTYSRWQLDILEARFAKSKNIKSKEEKLEMSKRVNLTPRQIRKWFENRRLRGKGRQPVQHQESFTMEHLIGLIEEYLKGDNVSDLVSKS